jgi:hypothetical protein
MKKVLSLIKSSLHDYRCCDETVTTPVDGVVLLWRALQSSLTCVLDGNNKNTGYVHVVTLQQYNSATGITNGVTKVNSPGDPNYIPDYLDNSFCAYGGNHQPLHGFTLSNVAPNVAGWIEIIGGPTIPFDQNSYQSLPSLGAGVITFNVRTRVNNSLGDPVAAVVDVDGVLHITAGDINLSIDAPIYSIVIRAAGYVG